MVVYEFAPDPERAVVLVDAYAAAGGPGRIRTPGDFSMVNAILGHINERACRQWLRAANDADRRRAEARFAEFDECPLTRELIDALLDALI